MTYGYGAHGRFCGQFQSSGQEEQAGEYAATKEVKPCHVGGKECKGPQKVDCHWSGWEPGKCANWDVADDAMKEAEEVTCGGGQRQLQRFIIQDSKNGGIPCDGPSEKLEPCNTQTCPSDPIVNCEWNPWSAWSVCDKCAGEKRRTRTIKTMPKNGGVCGPHNNSKIANMNSEEVDECERECKDEVFCEWGDWEGGECDAECGPGRQTRTRHLIGRNVSSERLFSASAGVPQHRFQDLLVSFGCGSLVTCLVAVVTLRMFRQDQSRSFVRAADDYTTGAE